jgi:hypothetical protein
LRETRNGIPLVKLCALARILVRTGMREQVPQVMARAHAELDHLKAESRLDQWERCRSLVAATEEWIQQEGDGVGQVY